MLWASCVSKGCATWVSKAPQHTSFSAYSSRVSNLKWHNRSKAINNATESSSLPLKFLATLGVPRAGGFAGLAHWRTVGTARPVVKTAAIREPEDLATVVLSPAFEHNGAPSALVVLIPGGFLYPKDYQPLLKAITAHSSTHGVSLWVAVAAIKWSELSPADYDEMPRIVAEAAETAVMAAVKHGFNSATTQSGRYANVFTAMHSISSLGAKEFPLKRCAGAILIGATLLGSKDFPPLAHTFPRPLMHIFGQADGQTPLAIAAVTIGDAAISAASLTPATAAKARPVVLISGCNHAHFSNGIVKTARGDLPTDTSIDASAEDIANALATFVAANAPGVNPDKANAAAKFLARETICSAMLLSSYAAVLGRIPLDKLYSHEISELGLTLARGTGAEMGYAANPLTAMLAHPGELRAAETFAVLLQRSLLHGLVPEDLADDISIAATVHTHPSTFTYSQATLLPPCGGEGDTYGAMAWSLQVHCLLERAERVGATPISTLAPVYALKLKSGAQVAAVLHAAGLMSQPSSRSAQEGEMTSAEVNNRVLRSAKKVMHPELLEEYEARGRPVTFTDNDLSGKARPFDWIQTPLALTYAPDGSAATVAFPCISTPVHAEGQLDEESSRFYGARYMKCPSAAWCMEWCMTGAFREPQSAQADAEE